MKAYSLNFKLVQSVLQTSLKWQSYMGLNSYQYGKKSRTFGELLQGSHRTSGLQTPTGIMLPLGLLVNQVLSNSKEVMCKILLN